MIEFLSQPWPWWVSGPLIGLVVPFLLLAGGKQFGVSENLRHLCAAAFPARIEFFQYDWKSSGLWNLVFILAAVAGGFLAARFLAGGATPELTAAAIENIRTLGLETPSGLAPESIFSWNGLASLPGLLMVVVGGFLVGFGTRWAGGCTSGHAISGLSNLQLPSLVAVVGFFAGGLIATHFLLPLILGG